MIGTRQETIVFTLILLVILSAVLEAVEKKHVVVAVTAGRPMAVETAVVVDNTIRLYG